jgi:hypothetical protein
MDSSPYRYNSVNASRIPWDQMTALQAAFAAATVTEATNNRVRQITQSQISAQAFPTNVNQSVAEKTIQKYTKLSNDCWGCGGSNRAYAKRDGTITCPNKDQPGVAEKTQKERRAAFNERIKKQHSTKKRSMSNMLVKALSALPPDKISATLSSAKKPKPENKGVTFLCDTASVFQSGHPAKHALPISIERDLPHINLGIGPASEQAQFYLSVAYDTGAVLNVRSAQFHLAIAERCPQLVQSLTWAKDDSAPIMLSGIVSDNQTIIKPTIALPAVIEHKLAYKTTEGYTATFKIAIGEQVSVNTIMGMAMIKPASLIQS